MLKKFSLAVVGLIIATLGARLVAWVTGDPRAPVTSTKQIGLIAFFFFFFLAVAWVLETKQLISLNWPWHRRRFFRDMSKVGTLGTERTLKDPNEAEAELLIDVMENGERKNLVRLLQEKLKDRGKLRRILILGDAGSGKSTALKQLRLRMLRDGTKRFGIGKPIPIFAPLGDYTQATLLDFIRDIFSKESRKLSAVMDKLLQEGHIVLLLDAIDEALSSNALREINALLSSPEYQNLAVVISGRRGEYEKALPADMEIFLVEDLSKDAVLSLSQRAITKQNLAQTPEGIVSSLEENQLLVDGGLGRNPFWLDLILKGETFSNSKTEIFAAALKALFDREWNRVGSKRLWEAALPKDEQFMHSMNSLADLALQISTRQQGEQIDGNDSLKIIDDYLSSQTGIEKLRPQDILWLAKDELLVNFDDLAQKTQWPPVKFRHRLIRDYLTAFELNSNPQAVVAVFDQHAADVNWWETLLMLRTLAADEFDFKRREELIHASIGKSQDPRRLFFARTMLESIDLIGIRIHEPIMDALVASLRQGVNNNHVEAAASVANVSPKKLTDFVKEMLDRNDPALTQNVRQLLKQLFEQQAGDKGNSRIFAHFLGNVYLYEMTKQVLVELGPAVTLRVIDVLHDSHYFARWHAAEVLGDIGDARAVDPLIKVLADSSETVKRAAVQSLGQLKDLRALRPMAKMFDVKGETLSDFLLQPTIIKALANFGPPAIDELINMLKTDDVTVRIFAAKSLKQIGPSASDALLELLDHPSTWTRTAAVELLGEFREVKAIEPLIGLLDCPDILVRGEVIDSLTLIGKPAMEPLYASLSATNREIRQRSAIVLGQIGDKRALEPLVAILKDRSADDSRAQSRSQANVRADAAQVLGSLGDVTAIPALQDAVENDRLAVGVAAMGSLAQLGDEKQLNELHILLCSPDPIAQFCAVQALGAVKNPKSLSHLEKFRKPHAQTDVSNATATEKSQAEEADRALRAINMILETLVGAADPLPPKDPFADDKMPEPRDLRSYAKVLKLEDLSVRVEATKALAEIGAEALDLLLVALQDQNAQVRIRAVVGLGKFGGERALEALLKILTDDPTVTLRMMAAESLGTLGLQAAIEPLKVALADKYLVVNVGAAIGLNALGEPGMVEELERILQKNKDPKLRYYVARAYLIIGDFKAIPYLDQSIKEWQDEGVAPEDVSDFESATTWLKELIRMQHVAAQPHSTVPQPSPVEPPGFWKNLRKSLFNR
jgi:HEAT repeat protein